MLKFVNNIVVVGLGGIGSWLVPPLARFLNVKQFKGEITLVDGDKFSENNLERQSAKVEDIGHSKAEAVAEKLAMPGLRVRTASVYLTAENIAELIKENSLVIMAVDNHPARALVSKFASTLSNICVLSAGNEKYDGNVHIYLKCKDKEETVSLLNRHPEIEKITEGDRAVAGCEELIQQGEAQLLVTNYLASAALLVAFYTLWEHKVLHKENKKRKLPVPQEIYFDVIDMGLACMPIEVKKRQHA